MIPVHIEFGACRDTVDVFISMGANANMNNNPNIITLPQPSSTLAGMRIEKGQDTSGVGDEG